MTRTASWRALLDAVDLADRLEDGLGALLGVEGDLLGQARRLVGVRLHLVDGDVHLVHRRAGLLGGERERVDVLGDLLDRVRHLLDRADRLAHAAGELADVLGDLVVGGGHLAGCELDDSSALDVSVSRWCRNLVDCGGQRRDEARGLLCGAGLRPHVFPEPSRCLVERGLVGGHVGVARLELRTAPCAAGRPASRGPRRPAPARGPRSPARWASRRSPRAERPRSRPASTPRPRPRHPRRRPRWPRPPPWPRCRGPPPWRAAFRRRPPPAG